MASTSLQSISEALQQVESKKSSLKKAFQDLHSQSSLLGSFPLQWSDLDSHFTSLQTSLAEKLRDLQALVTLPKPPEPAAEEVQARPELVALCEKMDGLGLRRYLCATVRERHVIAPELRSAIRRSPDPAKMILDAMGGFFNKNKKRRGDKDVDFINLRRSCLLLLSELRAIGAKVGDEVRVRATALAVEWKKDASMEEEKNPLAMLGFLHFVATFGLVSEFKVNEILDCFVIVSKYRPSVELFRQMGLQDHIEELVNKLASKGKQLFAVKFVFEFGVTDKFPPVPLLKASVKESKKVSKKVCKEGNYSLKSQNEGTAKEIGSLRSILKVVEERKLESEFPPEVIEKRIAELEKEASERKRVSVLRNQPGKDKFLQHSGNKRPRVDGPLGPVTRPNAFRPVNSYAHSYQVPHLQSTGLSTNGSAMYVGSSSAPYPVPGLVPAAVPQAGALAGTYGLAGTQVGVPGNPSVASSRVYMPESYGPPAYFERPTSYVGHGLQTEYHPPYYPQ